MKALLRAAIVATLMWGAHGSLAHAELSPAITTDSRIKTLVYNPNEVYAVTTHYGFQSNIEFGEKEVIETISVGDRVGWQISPAGRRLFIRAQEENAHTNMTIVTNLRAYQFDLRSSSADAVFGSAELTYVVRFYYPEERREAAAAAPVSAPPLPVDTGAVPMAMAAPPVVPVPAVPAGSSAGVPSVTVPAVATPASRAASTIVNPSPAVVSPAARPTYNYRYTYSGASVVAPVKIYDDGKTTYFKFARVVAPQVSVLTAAGDAVKLPTRITSDGLVAVDAVAPRFRLEVSGQQVVVYNEAGGVL